MNPSLAVKENCVFWRQAEARDEMTVKQALQPANRSTNDLVTLADVVGKTHNEEWDAALTVNQPCHNLSAMKTTIQLDDDLLAQATKLAREKGCDLSRLIEETLRDKIGPSGLPRHSRSFA